jgi:molecular chaperone GrpE (heat shock protein)
MDKSGESKSGESKSDESKSCESKSCESKSCDNSYKKISHEIRNMKPLTNEYKKNIKDMTNSELVNLILIYNDVINNLNDIMK